jgi:hypothetical protein
LLSIVAKRYGGQWNAPNLDIITATFETDIESHHQLGTIATDNANFAHFLFYSFIANLRSYGI